MIDIFEELEKLLNCDIFLSQSLNRGDQNLSSTAEDFTKKRRSKECRSLGKGTKKQRWCWCFMWAGETLSLGPFTLSSGETFARRTKDLQGYFLKVAVLTKLQPCCVVWGEITRTALVRAPCFHLYNPESGGSSCVAVAKESRQEGGGQRSSSSMFTAFDIWTVQPIWGTQSYYPNLSRPFDLQSNSQFRFWSILTGVWAIINMSNLLQHGITTIHTWWSHDRLQEI